MTLPNFFIIGAARCGTTSLYHYLNQHPQIYMSPVKEPNFFCSGEDERFSCGPGDKSTPVKFPDDYETLFSSAINEKAVGEATTQYMYYSASAKRIREAVPAAKIIALLRNPAQRAYTNFVQLINEGRETERDFRKALDAEPGRIRKKWASRWHYTKLGFYYEQLLPFYEDFGASKIKIMLQEELAADTAGSLKGIFEFLEVDQNVAIDISRRHHVSTYPKNYFLNKLMNNEDVKLFLGKTLPATLYAQAKKVKEVFFTSPPKIGANDYRHLQDLYRDDILKLEKLISGDLSEWLS